MRLKVWIKMGRERREAELELPEAVFTGPEALETMCEEIVHDWLGCRYGWGWAVLGTDVQYDAGFMEDADAGGLVITRALNRNTRRVVTDPPSS